MARNIQGKSDQLPPQFLRSLGGCDQNAPQMHRRLVRNQAAIRGNLARFHAKNMQRLHIRRVHLLIRTLLLNHKHRHPCRINCVQLDRG